MRFSLPNSRIMVHQPSGGFQGQATDIMIHARETQAIKDRLNEIYSKHTGQPYEVVETALERDRFMTPAGRQGLGPDRRDRHPARRRGDAGVRAPGAGAAPGAFALVIARPSMSNGGCLPGDRRGRQVDDAGKSGESRRRSMSKTGGGDAKNTLYCSFCGKSQHEVRKLIAGPTVFICDECVELCMDIIREETKSNSGQVVGRRADPARDLQGARRLRDRPAGRQARALGRGAQPLQAAEPRRRRTPTSSCRSRTSC